MSSDARTADGDRAPLPWAAPAFAWGSWLVMFVTALGFVWTYSRNVPYLDDWAVSVPIMVNAYLEPNYNEPSVAWLIESYNGYRIPLQRLMLQGLFKTLGLDVRIPLYFNVCALGALAFALIRTARNLRGRTEFTDAFFPILLLHWGRPNLYLWTNKLSYVVPMILGGTLLLLIARRHARLSLRDGLLAGICLLLLALSGPGLVFIPFLMMWIVCYGICQWLAKRPQARRDSVLVLGLALAAPVIVTLGISDPGFGAASAAPSIMDAFIEGTKVLAMSLGAGGSRLWPSAGIAVAGFILLSALSLPWVIWYGDLSERSRAFGLLCYLGFALGMAVMMGWKRYGSCTPGTDVDYYGLFPSLGLCAAYYVWELYRAPAASFIARTCLFALAAVLLIHNSEEGVNHAQARRDAVDAVVQDLEAGQPSYVILARHLKTLSSSLINAELMESWLALLRDARVGSFQHMTDNPPFRELRLPLEPVALNEMTWEGGTGAGTSNGYVEFALPHPRYVSGILIRCSHSNKQSAFFRVSWKSKKQSDFPAAPQFERLAWGELESPLVIWVADTIDAIRLYPDAQDFTVEVSEIVFRVPAPRPKGRANKTDDAPSP